MRYRSSICAIALVGALCMTIGAASAWDDSKYPDFSGQWRPIGGPGRWARDQKAPLTPEYQAIFEADASEGGQRRSTFWSTTSMTTAESSRTVARGPSTRHQRSSARPSANGSMKTETANSTSSSPRRAVSAVLVRLTPPACRCTGTTRPSSRNAFTSINPIRTSPTTRSP
jgi:hypothetical protein